MSTLCHNGHTSTDPDFCSVCNEEMPKVAPAVAPSRVSPQAVAPVAQDPAFKAPLRPVSGTLMGTCPDCHDAHGSDDGQYCLTCGYDFVSGQAGIPGMKPKPDLAPVFAKLADDRDAAAAKAAATNGGAATPVAVTPPVDQPGNLPAVPATARKWSIVVEVDPVTVSGAPNAEAPNLPPRVYDLTGDHLVLGRVAAPGVELVVQKDAGISRKQLEFVAQAGGFKFRDLASANGTRLLGVSEKLEPHAEYPLDRPLQDGDVLLIGEWTKLTVKHRS